MWQLFLLSACAAGCRPAECWELELDQCSVVEEGRLYVNSKGCPWDLHCSLIEVLASPTGLPCSETPIDLPLFTAHCGTRLPLKDFESGHSIVECESEQDCRLVDGSTTACQCGLRSDGRGLCVADLSNSVFDAYWEDCVDGRLYSSDAVDMWSLHMALWPLQLSDLTCSDFFSELQELALRQDTYKVAGLWLTLGWLAWT